MKPAPFKYHAPASVKEALSLLSEHSFDAKVLAGGQSLIPTMNFRLAQPEVLIDINGISELSYIRKSDSGGISIGAMTRHREVERSDLIAKNVPLLHETMPHIAHPQIRNRGTIGGSIVHADPAAELPAVMSALNARFLIVGPQGKRWVNVSDFFIGMFTIDMEAEELLVEIEIPPMPQHCGWAFKEIARRHGDFALVGLAANLTLDDDGKCQTANIVYLSVGDGPVKAEQAALSLIGEMPDHTKIETAAKISAEQDIDPEDDIHATAEFRRHLANVLANQALTLAFDRAKNA